MRTTNTCFALAFVFSLFLSFGNCSHGTSFVFSNPSKAFSSLAIEEFTGCNRSFLLYPVSAVEDNKKIRFAGRITTIDGCENAAMVILEQTLVEGNPWDDFLVFVRWNITIVDDWGETTYEDAWSFRGPVSFNFDKWYHDEDIYGHYFHDTGNLKLQFMGPCGLSVFEGKVWK